MQEATNPPSPPTKATMRVGRDAIVIRKLNKDDIFNSIVEGWTDLKANLGGGDDSILSSMETGDNYAKKEYDKQIQEGKLPGDVLGVVRNQAQAIVGTLDRIKALRQQHKAA